MLRTGGLEFSETDPSMPRPTTPLPREATTIISASLDRSTNVGIGPEANNSLVISLGPPSPAVS